MRWTKMVATVGPSTSTPERLSELLAAGVDVVRLNFSHGRPEEHWERLRQIRRWEKEQGRPISVLQDLPGPKLRVGLLKQDRALESGEEVLLTGRSRVEEERVIPCTYPQLAEEVQPGHRILLDDGRIELEVERTAPPDVSCRVVEGGVLSSHKGINLPDTPLRLPALTERDRAYLRQGLEHGVDYIAVSFVRTPRDMEDARALVQTSDASPKLIAKIEKPEAVEHLKDILQLSDGVMVARGDLGVELPIEDVPVVQKHIITAANNAGVLVITATQMLESMTHEARPTRAEATDVANAVLDGTDALMLSGETAIGTYPVEAVRVMDRIIRQAEHFLTKEQPWSLRFHEWRPDSFADAIAFAACHVAHELKARALVPFSRSGFTALCVSKLHPRKEILAFTPSISTWRQMALFWGVRPILLEPISTTEEMVERVEAFLIERGWVGAGDTLVLLAGAPTGMAGTTNSLRLLQVGGEHC